MTRMFLTLVTVFTMCSCRHIPSAHDNTRDDKLKSLNEFSTEQIHVFLKGYSGDWKQGTPESLGVQPPPIQKPYAAGSKLIDLARPENIKLGNAPVAKIINQRRSRRSFTGEVLTNEELSYLLWSTQGISKIEKDANGNVMYHFRTVPSGGSKHPFETYLIINRVEGVKPGLYRFLPIEHKLLVMREAEDFPQRITDSCYGQKHTGEAAVVFIWSVIPARTEWHYGCVAHKLISIDAGHLCQNLYLAAESIDAGTCAMLGYNQAKLDRLIEVDGKEEFAFYLAAVGKIKAE